MDENMYVIEKAGLEAAAALSKLWKETFEQAYRDVHSLENIQAYCDNNFSVETAVSDLKNDKVVCKIARLNEVPVGFYLLKTHDSSGHVEGSSTELKQIYILSDHYGEGLGRQLYQDAMTTIKENGSTDVWLYVSDINERAKAFYDKLGFEVIGIGPVFVVGSDRLTSTTMRKRVA